MRRSLLAAALILATGGWVCDSAGSCPQDELTCPSDVADHICCPQGSPYRCGDTCSATPECSDYLVCKYPDDTGSGLCTGGAYKATIDGITCTPPTTGNTYKVTITGTLVGCGPSPVAITEDSSNLFFVSADCGSWRLTGTTPENSPIQCTPGGTVPLATQWHVQSAAIDSSGTVYQASVSVTLGVGGEPVLAQKMLACPTSP